MNQKQTIKTILFLLVFSVILFSLNSFILFGVRNSEFGQMGKVSQIMNHKINSDIIIFGASNGETGINPSILENKLQKSAFNMCLSGTSIHQFKDLVLEYNDYKKDSSLVILAFGPFAFSKVNLPTALNNYYAWIDTKYISQNGFLNQSIEITRLKYIPFYGFVLYDNTFYRNSIDGWMHVINKPVLSTCYQLKGWDKQDLKWGENNTVGKLDEKIKIPIDSSSYGYYRQIINELNLKGKKVILVLMPSYAQARNNFIGLDNYRQALLNLCKNKCLFLDYSFHPVTEEKKYFYNYTHLNALGANYFSEVVSEDIQKLSNR